MCEAPTPSRVWLRSLFGGLGFQDFGADFLRAGFQQHGHDGFDVGRIIPALKISALTPSFTVTGLRADALFLPLSAVFGKGGGLGIEHGLDACLAELLAIALAEEDGAALPCARLRSGGYT